MLIFLFDKRKLWDNLKSLEKNFFFQFASLRFCFLYSIVNECSGGKEMGTFMRGLERMKRASKMADRYALLKKKMGKSHPSKAQAAALAKLKEEVWREMDKATKQMGVHHVMKNFNIDAQSR